MSSRAPECLHAAQTGRSAYVFRPVNNDTGGDNQVLVVDAQSGNQIVLLDSEGSAGTMSWQRTSP